MTKRRILKGSLALVGLLAGVFLVIVSGVMPIKASSDHWPITKWLLHFAMRRSVATHSMGIEPPPLDAPALVLRGAGHYESGCRPCHGAPGPRDPEVPSWMTPHPPDLGERIPTWQPDELFYVVKHGIKFTGMPAFPSQKRDDEVWAVVAFLLALPDMSPAEYRALAYGEEADPPSLEPGEQGLLTAEEPPPLEIARTCGRCHGANGLGRGVGAFPKLAGQKPAYLEAALAAYVEGERESGIMATVATGLSDEAMAALARYYAGLPAGGAPSVPPDPEAVERGRRIAMEGVPERKVPACSDCHGPAPEEKNPHYPRLAGQYASYLELQLELFSKGVRGGSAYAHLMQEVAPELEPEEMRDVAAFYASLPPER